MKRVYFYIAILVSFSSSLIFAQAPVIQKIEPLTTYPNDTIVISGNGFSNDPTDLQVWFGPVKGNIVRSSNFGIEVTVPPQATVSNIEVLNLSTGRSARSLQKFMPTYHGVNFNINNFADLNADTKYSATQELYDFCGCDLNHDGKPDVAVTKTYRTSQVFPNPTDFLILRNVSTGPGQIDFATQSVPLGFGTDNVICGDVDGDGKRDLVLTRATPARNSVIILRNTTASAGASITFAPAFTLFLNTGDVATRLALVDMTLDGRPELVVTSSATSRQFYVFTNFSSPGTLDFNDAPPLVLSTNPVINNEAEIQDFNGDGLPDIVINVFQGGDLYVFKNTTEESLSFAPVQKITLPGNNSRLVSYDFGGSELPDIAVTNTLDNQTAILINESTTSTISFAAPVQLTTAEEPWGLDVSDIDGDGDADLTVANIIAGTATVNVFANDGTTGTAFTRSDFTTNSATRNARAIDFDGDAKPDLAYTAFNDSPGSIGSFIAFHRNENCHQPKILNEGPFSLCPGQTIRLHAVPAPGVTFDWKKDGASVGSTTTPHFDITSAGTYTVTTKNTDNSCEVTSANLVVSSGTGTAPNYPVIAPVEPLCSSESLALTTSTMADEYFWTGPNGFTSNQQNPSAFAIDTDDAGEYSLQVRVGQCKSNVAKVRVDVLGLEDLKITSNRPDVLCEDKTATLTINVSPTDYDINWSTGLQDVNTLSVTSSGTYSAEVTNLELGCDIQLTPVTFTFLTKPVASFTVEDGCVNEELVFDNQSVTDPNGTPVYAWTFETGATSNVENPTYQYSEASSVTPRLIISYAEDEVCTSNEASQTIEIINAIIPVISPTDSVTCKVILGIPDGFKTAEWSTGETGNSIVADAGEVTVNTIDVNDCPATATYTVAELVPPVVDVTPADTTISAGSSVRLNATPGGQVYAWSPESTLDAADVASPTATLEETTTYTVVVTDKAGCTTEAQITINVEGAAPFPPGFSPNGDGINETWTANGAVNAECTLNIFDGRGRRIFEGKGEGWDGTYQGNAVPEGTYYFVYSCPDAKPQSGSLLLFR